MLSIIICVAIGLGLFLGYRRGIVRQVGSLVAVVVALVVSRLFGGKLTGAVAHAIGADASPENSFCAMPLASFIAHVLLFVVAWLGVGLLARTLHELIKIVRLGFLNSLAGALFMAFKIALVASLLLNLRALGGDAESQPEAGGPVVEATASLAPAMLGYLQCNF